MADARPTEQSIKVFEELNARLVPELKRLQNVFDIQVPAFNNAVKQLEFNVVDPARVLKERNL
jgi:fumarate hydratase class II